MVAIKKHNKSVVVTITSEFFRHKKNKKITTKTLKIPGNVYAVFLSV